MHTPIDLGRTSDFGPCNPVSLPEKDTPRVYYPEFTYSGDKELDLPDEGVMEIRFRKVREVEEKRDGKDHYTCTVEVCEILEIENEEEVESPTGKYSDAEAALDAIAAALKK